MSTKNVLETDLKEAMRRGDETRKRTIRLALASIKMVEIDQGGEISQEKTLAVLQKEIKSREESIEAAQSGGREDLILVAEAEMMILKEYLPEQLSEAEIEALAKETIEAVSASSIRDMGNVMKQLLPKISGRAASSQVSQIVKNLLNE